MTVEVILTNARIVTADSEFDGTVVVRDGLIAEVADCRSHVAGALDLEGDYLVPGLVELHTDNMEKHFAPRPGVRWPSLSAVMAHDTQIAAAGITTVFDSLALGDVRGDTDRVLNRERMIDAVLAASERRLFRADHRLHLRCEIVADDAVDAVDRWIDLPLVGLLSINDHTPGQRQFLDPEKLRLYHTKKYGMTNDEFELFSARATALHHKNAARHRREIVARAQARALPLASHDDATHEHVQGACRRAQPGDGRLALGQHRRHRPSARRPGRHPLFRLCAGQPDGKRLQAAQCRRRHRVARGGARGLAYAGARRGPRRSRRDRSRAPRRSRARPRIRGRPRGAGGVARR
jgi:alpha-D-ribose 1-methylphosphonate 5-triphosphate diphosphatase PhnM